MKTVTISVRVSQEDAQFIAELEVPGASTPSDKLRAILAEARARQEGGRDFASALAMMEDLLAPARRRFREAEHRHRMSSDMLATAFDRLPEVMASLMATDPRAEGGSGGRSGGRSGGGQEKAALAEWEGVLADRIFALIEAVVRLGMTRQCRCYDGQVVTDRLGPMLEMARLIDARRGEAG